MDKATLIIIKKTYVSAGLDAVPINLKMRPEMYPTVSCVIAAEILRYQVPFRQPGLIN
jgi:hypothetical protein